MADESIEYHVEWKIDLSGPDAVSAAMRALEMMRDTASTATVFAVTNSATGERYEVDLAPLLCECADGVLPGQTYGHTDPPGDLADVVLIQRCDLCERYPGDVDAAQAHAQRWGGVVHAVGDGEMLAPQSDPWVVPGATGDSVVVWHPTADASAAGIYYDPESED